MSGPTSLENDREQPQQLARCAAELLVAASGLDLSGVALFGASGQLCMEAACRHRDVAWAQLVVQPGDGLASRVLREGQSVAIVDYAEESGASARLIEVWRREAAFAMVAVPIRRGKTIVGVAYGGLRRRELIADRARTAMENVVRLFAATSASATEWRVSAPETGGGCGLWWQSLSWRETQMLRHLSEGASTAEIARAECLAVNSVRTYVQSALGKLGAHNRLQAVVLARQAGVI